MTHLPNELALKMDGAQAYDRYSTIIAKVESFQILKLSSGSARKAIFILVTPRHARSMIFLACPLKFWGQSNFRFAKKIY